MWAGNWNSIHEDVYKYADCHEHKHANLEDLKSGTWEKKDKDLFEKWVRRKALDPFLYMELYGFPNFNHWATEADLLPKACFISDGAVEQKNRDAIVLMDTVAYHLPWMMQFLQVLSENCKKTRDLVTGNKKEFQKLEKCCLLSEVVNCICKNSLYKMIRTYIPSEYSDKMVAAAFSITFVLWHQLVEQKWYHNLPDLGSPLSEEEEKLKEMGNQRFKNGSHKLAIQSYTDIIKNKTDNAIAYSNRAQAFLKLLKFSEAEVDGRRTIILLPSKTRGYMRLAGAKEGMKQFHSAHLVAQFGEEVCSDTENCMEQLDETSTRLEKICQKDGECSKHILDSNGPSNLPDLLSDSGSDSESPSKSPMIIQQAPVIIDKPPIRSSMFQFTLVELLNQLKGLQRQGSDFFLGGKMKEAVEKYQQALDILPSLAEQNYEIDSPEKVCLMYALAIAYLNVPSQDMKCAIDIFEDILKNYKDLHFTAAHSGLGQAYINLYRFELAMECLTFAQEGISKDPLRTYTWPATNIVINNTIPDKHKKTVVELMQTCQYPPTPDAICRYDNCLLPTKTIYLKAPDYKGFYRLFCSAYCKMEYHPQCWKRVKDQFDGSQKVLIGQKCPTPDCGEGITSLEKYDVDGSLSSKTEKKKEKNTKVKKKKDQRKQHKLSESAKEEDPASEPCSETPSVAPPVVIPTSENLLEGSGNDNTAVENKPIVSPFYDVNTKPSYVIRKEDHLEEIGIKNNSINQHVLSAAEKRKREKREKKKQSTISVDEFCGNARDQDFETETNRPYYNQYLKRVRELQEMKNKVEEGQPNYWPPINCNMVPLSVESPFYIPEYLRDNPEALERTLRENTMTLVSQDSPANQNIKDTVYGYMEDFLVANGPVHKDSPLLAQEVNGFPGPTQALISESNGLIDFLKQSVRFVLLDNFLCSTSQMGLNSGDAKLMHQLTTAASGDKEFRPAEKLAPPAAASANQKVEAANPRPVTRKQKKEPRTKEVSPPLQILPENRIPGVALKKKKSETESPASKIEVSPTDLDLKTRSNSMDSNRSTSSLSSYTSSKQDRSSSSQLEPSSSSPAFNSIKKLAKTFSEDVPVALFKLQVSISALPTGEQEQVACAILNSFKANTQTDFWERVNSQLAEVRVLCKDMQKEDSVYKSQLAQAELEELRLSHSKLEERLCAALDTNEKLKNSQTLSKKLSEEQIAELKGKNQKLQASLNAAQTKLESEKQHLQQEKLKVKEEAIQLRKEKEDEVATARLLLTKVTDENKKLKLELDKEKDANNQFQMSITTLMENCEDASTQAQQAKINLLQLKKQEGIKDLEQEFESIVKIKGQLLDAKRKEAEKPVMSASVFEVLVETPLRDLESYFSSLRDVKMAFLELHDRHLSALEKNLDPPEQSLEMPVLPKKPETLTSFSQTAMAASMLPNFYSSGHYPNFNLPGGNMFRSSLNSSPDLQQPPSSTTPQTNLSYPSLFTNSYRGQMPPMNSMTGQGMYLPGGMHYPSPPMFANMNLQPNKAMFNGPNNMQMRPPLLTTPMHMQTQFPSTPNPFMINPNPFSVPASTNNTPNGLSQANNIPVTPTPITSNSVSSVNSQVTVNSVPNGTVPNAVKTKVTGTTNGQPATMPASTVAPIPQSTAVGNSQQVAGRATPISRNSVPQAQISTSSTPLMSMAAAVSKSKPELAHLPAVAPSRPLPTVSQLPAPVTSSTANSKHSFDKLIKRLNETYTTLSPSQLEGYIRLFRSQRNGLTGMSIDKIIDGVSALITKQEAQKSRILTTPVKEMRRPAASTLDIIEHHPLSLKGSSSDPWGASSVSNPSYKGNDDNTCSICLESMTSNLPIHQTECKHRFHYRCIQEWLKRNSTCPNCISHALLPQDYPPLGS